MADFFIGAATAAHQVEGNNINSDFWKLEQLPHSSFVERSLDACDHYNRYEEDIRLLKEAGCNAYRFSIEWARVEPEQGRFDPAALEHYRRVLEFCHSLGILPIVTLMHFSSPAWLIPLGGWGDPAVVPLFARYCGHIAKELGGLLGYVCTINEANMGYQLHKITEDMMKASQREGNVQVGVNLDMETIMQGMKEQGEAFGCDPRQINTFLTPRSLEQELIVMEAHKAACQAIKENAPHCKTGLTLSLFDYQPVPGGEEQAAKLWQEDFGFYLPHIERDDFLGVQNYSRKIVDENGVREPAEGVPCTQMGYEEYPLSIGHVVEKVAKEFHGELIVTENGLATDDDTRRCEFIPKAVQSVLEAGKKGAPVLGYLYWSLLDNFEWQAGFSKTFGLIAVDRAAQICRPKESLKVLGSMRE